MDSPVIVISSDSSAPSSPLHKIGSKRTLDCADEHHSDSDARSDSTVDYYQPQTGNRDHESCIPTSPLLADDSGNSEDCAQVQLSNSDAESDTTVDFYPPVNFIKQTLSNHTSQDSVFSANSSNSVLQKAQKIDNEDSNGAIQNDLDQREVMEERYQLPSASNVLTEDYSEKGREKRRGKDVVADVEKGRRRAERIKDRAMKQAEQAQKKAVKKAATEAYRSKKPGECLKYVRVCLDQQLLTAEYGGEILVSLQKAEMQYNIQSNPVPFSIIWTREVQEHSVGGDMKVHVRSRDEEEEEMLIVWHWDKVLKLIHVGDLTNHVQSLQLTLPGKKLTLVIYGAEEYFRHQKTFKRRAVRATALGTDGKSKPNRKEANFESAPRVSQDEWETALTELHLFANCSHRLVEKPQAFGTFIKQFTKAVAEVPFKHEKHKREQEKLLWYAAGDSRECVRVDKNGNGLFRLWQQQMCQFNRVAMETAQAITSVYRSPRALLEAYENCSSEHEAELMLEAIQIRRGVGPLATVKKVGPELSKKVCTFFTSLDGKGMLSQE